MTIEMPYSEFIKFFFYTICFTWILTIVRTMSGRYPMERYWNSTVFSTFCCGVITIVAILATAYNPPETTSLKMVFPEISSNNALFYLLGVAIIGVALYYGALLPLYRALKESDEAKDRRFGIVPNKED